MSSRSQRKVPAKSIFGMASLGVVSLGSLVNAASALGLELGSQQQSGSQSGAQSGAQSGEETAQSGQQSGLEGAQSGELDRPVFAVQEPDLVIEPEASPSALSNWAAASFSSKTTYTLVRPNGDEEEFHYWNARHLLDAGNTPGTYIRVNTTYTTDVHSISSTQAGNIGIQGCIAYDPDFLDVTVTNVQGTNGKKADGTPLGLSFGAANVFDTSLFGVPSNTPVGESPLNSGQVIGKLLDGFYKINPETDYIDAENPVSTAPPGSYVKSIFNFENPDNVDPKVAPLYHQGTSPINYDYQLCQVGFYAGYDMKSDPASQTGSEDEVTFSLSYDIVINSIQKPAEGEEVVLMAQSNYALKPGLTSGYYSTTSIFIQPVMRTVFDAFEEIDPPEVSLPNTGGTGVLPYQILSSVAALAATGVYGSKAIRERRSRDGRNHTD